MFPCSMLLFSILLATHKHYLLLQRMKSPSASPGGKSQHSPGIGSIEIAPRSRWDVSVKRN